MTRITPIDVSEYKLHKSMGMRRAAPGLANHLFAPYAKPMDASQIITRILKGEARLENLEIVDSALASHDLLFKVTRGAVGTVDLIIPCTSLRHAPVVVDVADVFVLGAIAGAYSSKRA